MSSYRMSYCYHFVKTASIKVIHIFNNAGITFQPIANSKLWRIATVRMDSNSFPWEWRLTIESVSWFSDTDNRT